jgi:hypothetical protein
VVDLFNGQWDFSLAPASNYLPKAYQNTGVFKFKIKLPLTVVYMLLPLALATVYILPPLALAAVHMSLCDIGSEKLTMLRKMMGTLTLSILKSIHA